MSSKNRNYNDKLVIININAHTGDKIKLNLPMDFVKKIIKNNAIDFFLFEEDIVDTNKLINFMMNAFKYEVSGEVAYLERNNGDIVRIRID